MHNSNNYPLEPNLKYSNEQLRAIYLEDNNILVSAAAGSGKTTVLVERIVKELETGLCDINDMLVMTFTRASAADMKNKIKLRIDERLKYLKTTSDIKDNNQRIKRLKNQSLFIQNANISTIDSFCKRLVDENFSALDELDAKYRVADENELNILKSDLLNRFLESKYGQIDKEYNVEFNNFFRCYFERNDKKIRDIIIKGINFLDTLPYVDEFFDKHLLNYDKTNEIIEKEIKNTTDEELVFIKNVSTGIDDNNSKDKINNNDYILLVLLKQFYELYSNEKANRRIIAISDFQKYALKLLKKEDKEGKLIIANKYQQKFKRIMVDEYQDTSDIQEEILKAISNNYKNCNVFMVGDVKQCIYAFRNAKPNIFNEKYNSYIDINKINENPIKQNVLIKLSNNYRSSNEVIDTTNIIFNNVMHKEYGDIDYKERGVALSHCRNENDNNYAYNDKSTKIVLFKDVSKGLDDELKTDIRQNQIKQGRLKKTDSYELNEKWDKQERISYVFDIIKNLHDNEGAKYKDIVILHPTPNSLIEDYAREAFIKDIPFVGNIKTGFYNSYEIILMCAILSVIDNPVNDVDLSTVLLSKLIRITDEDLVLIKSINNYIKTKNSFSKRFFSLYETILNINIDKELEKELIEQEIIEKKAYDELKSKIEYFFDLFDKLRQYQRVKSISELVNIIYDEANIYNYMRTMKNGSIRILNLDLFLQKAKIYEKTSYSGLFNFLRYIEQIKINDIDDSPAAQYDENDDVVRLLSIHSSKGLQYPIVILPRMESKLKPYNITEPVLFDEKYGVGLMHINYQERYSHESIKYHLIKAKQNDEEKQEKMRLLYVGLTRASEKLVITMKATNDDYNTIFPKEKKSKKTVESSQNIVVAKHQKIENPPISLVDIKNASTYKDLIMFSINELINAKKNQRIIDVFTFPPYKLVTDEVSKKDTFDDIDYDSKDFDNLKKLKIDLDMDINVIRTNISKVYANQYLTTEKPKYSVSEIKHNKQKLNIILDKEKVYQEHEIEDLDLIEDLDNNIERMDGTEMGTAIHSFMEHYDFKTDIKQFLNNMSEAQSGKSKALQTLDRYIDNINNFLSSNLGKTIINAKKNNKLYREQRFMIEMPLSIIKEYMCESISINSLVIVQGVIDAFYINDNGNIVLIDYKTDGLINHKVTKKQLIDNYKIQMDLYEKALMQITGKTVDKKYIYSFALNEAIEV